MASPKDPQVAAMKTIEAALKLIDTKKENLKKAYDDLQAHSSLLSSFSLSWSGLDSHFTSLQNNLTRRFQLLQSLAPCQNGQQPSDDRVDSIANRNALGVSNQSQLAVRQDPSSSFNPPSHGRVDSHATCSEMKSLSSPTEEEVVPAEDPASQNRIDPSRPELISLCERMNGKGLRKYINKHAKQRDAIRVELPGAMRVAMDQGAMVLDAMEGFYSSNPNSKGDKDLELCRVRRTCLDLLEALTKNKPNLSDEVKERAKKLALEWKGKVSLNGDSPLEALAFLHLLVAYKLENEFDVGEFVDIFVVVARFKQAAVLCRDLGLGEKTADLIQKLIDNGKHFLAVKFILEFGLIDKFQPVPLLKAHLKESKKFTKEVCDDGKNSIKAQNEARSREVNALKSVLKLIDEHKLGSEYPRADLEKRIDILEKEKVDNKRPAPSPVNKPQQQQKQPQQAKQQSKKKQQAGNKRPRTTAPAVVPDNIIGSSSTIPPFQQSHFHPAAGMYGLVGSTPPAYPYTGSSAGPYGLSRAAMGFPGNPSPSGAHLGFSEPQMPFGYYDRPAAYGGYGLPHQYHPAYYPN